MDFDRVQAEWVLDRFPRAQLPEVAAQAMVAGFEGPNLLDLVGYAAPSLHRLSDEVVEGAFREMGRPPLTRREAALRLAQVEALRLLRGQTLPMTMAEDVAVLVLRLNLENLAPALEEFRHLLDEDSYWSHHPVELDQYVVELAWALLEEDPPG
jgi:hypothetical protein